MSNLNYTYEKHSTRDVKWNGHTLVYRAYFEEQAGTPVVFIHGLVASIDFFSDENFRQLKSIGPIYTISLPGHAPSVMPNGHVKTDPDLLAGSAAAQIKDFAKGRPVMLVGHSTGATAALALAIQYPELVAGVVICEGAAHGRESNGIFRTLQWLVLKLGIIGTLVFKSIFKINGFRPWTNRLFLADLFADKKKMDAYPHMWATQAKYWPALQALDLDVMKNMFADLDTLDLRPSLKNIKAPTLVILGEKDPFIPREEAQTLLDNIPNSKLYFIDGGGHVPFFETPDKFQSAILEFVQRVGIKTT